MIKGTFLEHPALTPQIRLNSLCEAVSGNKNSQGGLMPPTVSHCSKDCSHEVYGPRVMLHKSTHGQKTISPFLSRKLRLQTPPTSSLQLRQMYILPQKASDGARNEMRTSCLSLSTQLLPHSYVRRKKTRIPQSIRVQRYPALQKKAPIVREISPQQKNRGL